MHAGSWETDRRNVAEDIPIRIIARDENSTKIYLKYDLNYDLVNINSALIFFSIKNIFLNPTILNIKIPVTYSLLT